MLALPLEARRIKAFAMVAPMAELVPMPFGDLCSVSDAVRIASVSDQTVYRWCRDFGIGRISPYVHRWQVSVPGLRMVRAGDWDALEAFRAGDRTSATVADYFASA